VTSILLDTHTFIWLSENDANLPISVLKVIDNAEAVFVSIVSFWEIAIKLNLNKLTLQEDFDRIESRFGDTGLILLPICINDTVQLRKLALFSNHKDPFDRMLIAQAIAGSMPIVSADKKFDAYPVQRVWGGEKLNSID
jgi:PIN domain nuclease of toxin-antitoxin system